MTHASKMFALTTAICIVVAAAAAADPIQITSGSYTNSRTDSSLTIAAPGLAVNLVIPSPTWFGILNPGELVTFDFTNTVPFPTGTVQFGGITYPAPITFEGAFRTPEFRMEFGQTPPFAMDGFLTDGFGRIDLTGGGRLSISDAALSFNFEPNPPPVPAPVPEPATCLLVGSGVSFVAAARRRIRH